MQTSPTRPVRNRSRQKWITAYRITTVVLLVASVVIGGILLTRSPSPTITAKQANKVTTAATFLQDVGFNNPVYLGITPGAEGEYPTFQATAIGGKPIKLWIRTTPNGGLEIQPVGLFQNVASADDLARLAEQAVFDWQNMPPSIKPRTDGSFGEYESRRYDYRLLHAYDPGKSYWATRPDETAGWPTN